MTLEEYLIAELGHSPNLFATDWSRLCRTAPLWVRGHRCNSNRSCAARSSGAILPGVMSPNTESCLRGQGEPSFDLLRRWT